MTDILLINPKSFNTLPSYLPYGLLYIAAFLRKNGLKVKIYDSNTASENFLVYIKKILKKEKPVIAGISALSGPCLADAVTKAKLIRKYFPQIKIVFGGIHTTILPYSILKQPWVDYIIINEGEEAMLELCRFILKKKGKLKNIKNLGYKIRHKLICNKIRPFIDLNKLPLPAWDLLPMEKYIHNKFYCDRVIALHTSRGCPWNCSFCYNRLVNFRRWRAMSAEKILEQINHLILKYQIKGFQFYDDEFDANPQRVVDFCRLILKKKLKIKWAHNSRVNVADKTRYALEKKAGCEFIEFGVESGSARILKMLQKQQTLKDIKRAFKICHQTGLKAGALFMTGLPTETEKDLKMTLELINSLKAQQVINTIYRPYPGSDLFNYCLRHHLIKMPENPEEQGRFFDIGSSEINVSRVNSNYLQNLHEIYFFKNILQELKSAWQYKNFKLIFFYFKSRFNFENIILLLKSLKSFLFKHDVKNI